MADNLTVKTGKAAAGAPAGRNEDAVDSQDAELDRLRRLAKQHHGKTLSDNVLRAIRARQKAKRADMHRLAQAKQSFETEQGKEKASAREAKQQSQVHRVTGSEEIKLPGSLQAKDSKEVRSNPKSGPKLPPTLAKATTPEQATKLLDKMLSFVQIDGKPIDRTTYLSSLRERPPAPLKETPKAPARKGTHEAAKANRMFSGQHLGKAPPGLQAAKAKSNAHPSPQATGGTKAQAGPSLQQQAPPLAHRPAGPSLAPDTSLPAASMSLRGGSLGTNAISSGTGVSPEGLFNAGGGLITNSSFDGMSFNWEAFQWFFTMVVMKDLHKYRKMMKELRRLEGKASLAGMKLKEAITRMRQVFERNHAMIALFESVRSAVGTIKSEIMKAKAEKTLGKTKGELQQKRAEIEKLRTGLDSLRQRIGELRKQQGSGKSSTPTELGRSASTALTTLGRGASSALPTPVSGRSNGSTELGSDASSGSTEAGSDASSGSTEAGSGASSGSTEAGSELPSLEQRATQMETRLETLEAERSELEADIRNLEGEQSGAGGELEELAQTYQPESEVFDREAFSQRLDDYRNTVAGLMAHEDARPALEQRGAEISEALRLTLSEIDQNERDIERLKGERRALVDGEEGEESENDAGRTPERLNAEIARLEERNEVLESRKTLLSHKVLIHESVMASLTSEKERLAALSEARQQESAGAEGMSSVVARLERVAQGADPMALLSGAENANQARLAGSFLRNQRSDDVLKKLGAVAGKGAELAGGFEQAYQNASKEFEAAVDRLVDHSLQIDLEARQDANRQLRRTAARTQGMINQLMQLLRMARST